MHTIKLVLNENHAITESNYDNNIIFSVGTWQSCIALSIDTFDAENGTYEVHSMTPKKFEFKVTNRGNVAVEEGYIMCKVDGLPRQFNYIQFRGAKTIDWNDTVYF